MFKLRSDFNLAINNGIIGKVGYPRLVSLVSPLDTLHALS